MRNLFLAFLTLFLPLFFTAQITYAININGCDSMLNKGLYKKYEYQGIDQPATKATKKHGSIKSTGVTTTERTTASVDPKYWLNVTMSHGQYTSSTGSMRSPFFN